MKYVHTFWIDEGKDPLDASFGWCSARYHLMTYLEEAIRILAYSGVIFLKMD